MAETTNLHANLVAPGLKRVFFDEYSRMAETYSKIINVETAPKRKYWDDYVMAGFGSVPQKVEGTAFAFDAAIPGNTKRYTLSQYALGYRVTREMGDDDLYDVMKNLSKLLAHSVKDKIEVLGHAVLNDAFAGNTYTGAAEGDGTARRLVVTGHQLLGGGTYSNAPSAATDISQTALQSAITRMRKTVDERNLIINLKPSLVVVPAESEFIMEELLGSDKKPYTSDNEINALKGQGLKWRSSPWITDTDSWHLLSDQHDINFFWRVKPEWKSWDDNNTADSCHTVYFRCVTGFTDWRGADGSTGA